MNNSGEYRYIFNELYITDYCVWIQTCDDEILAEFSSECESVKLDKTAIGFDLELLETAAKSAIEELEAEMPAKSANAELRRETSAKSVVEELGPKTAAKSAIKEFGAETAAKSAIKELEALGPDNPNLLSKLEKMELKSDDK